MAVVKLSIHEGYWRFAFTSESIHGLSRGAARQLTRFSPPDEIASGWRRAAVILTPTPTLGRPHATDESVSHDDIQWWAAPPHYQHLQFHVFIGEPNADRDVVLKDVVGPVGFIRYGAGHLVSVFASVVVLNSAELKMVADLRASASIESMKDPVSMLVWGDVVDDGTPHLIDIALR